MPFPLIPVIAAGAALGGQLIGGLFDKRADEKYNQQQIDLAKLTNAQNIEFWKMQNAYNTPAAQMSRYKEAGLNPNLIYGQGTPGNATPISPMSRPDNRVTSQGDRAAKSLGAMTDFMQMRAMEIEMANREQDTRVKEAEETKKRKETLGVELNNELLWQLMPSKKGQAEANVRKTEAETALKKWQAEKEKIDYKFKSGTFNERINAARYLAEQARANLKGQELLNALRQLEVDLNKLGIQKTDHLGYRILGRFMNEFTKRNF